MTFDDIIELVRKTVVLAGGLDGIVSDGDKVTLKPNLVTMRCKTLPGKMGRRLPHEVKAISQTTALQGLLPSLCKSLTHQAEIYVMEVSVQDTAEVFIVMNYTR